MMTEQQQIDEILLEANAYGVRTEVIQLAAFLIFVGYDIIIAYQRSYAAVIYFYYD